MSGGELVLSLASTTFEAVCLLIGDKNLFNRRINLCFISDNAEEFMNKSGLLATVTCAHTSCVCI